MIFTYFQKLYQIKVLFNKIPTRLVENKNKIPSWVENKKFRLPLKNWFFVAWIRIRDPNWGKNPGSGSVKDESGSETLVGTVPYR